ncbi:hypothetical protein [Lentilactobacillus parafarraginis]|uniref:hypothetical protein n=1 Tax=Lentilactobacillus parafarraginis TaxID=390842 RepID=UPI0003167908|nr:hypothetical protein [Lentilactobacillus parafarraginis]
MITGGLLLIPLIGSIYPQPEGAAKYFPYIFGAWIVIALIFHAIKQRTLRAHEAPDEL